MFLTKYSSNGMRLWTEQLGSTGEDFGYGVSVDGSGNAYVTGCTWGVLDGNTKVGIVNMFLTKYDTSGAKQWTKQLDSGIISEGHGVSTDGNGNVYVTGKIFGDLDGNTDAGGDGMLVIKYDTNGNRLWGKQLGSDGFNCGYDVSVDVSGNAYITGVTYGSLDGNPGEGYEDSFLAKFDTNGNRLWAKQLGSTSSDYGYGVSVDESGNAYITGFTHGDIDGNTGEGGRDIFLAKYDTNGNKQWTNQLGTSQYDIGYGVSVDSIGNAYVTGTTEGGLDGNTNAGPSYRDVFLTKYDTNGVKLWTEQFGTPKNDFGRGVSVDGIGNAYLTGFTEGDLNGSTNMGGTDMFLIKVSTVPVPEPGSLVLLVGVGLMGLLCWKRRR